MIFQDRTEAGKVLAKSLEHLVDQNTVILAIPRGGVVVGYEIAKELDLHLDVIILKKLGAPGNSELAIGAVSADGGLYVDREVADYVGATDEYIKKEISRMLEEIHERERLYRGSRPPVDVTGLTVVVVDDGVATGSTFIAAVKAIRSRNPKRIIAAIPVAPPEALRRLDEVADEVICLYSTEMFFAVGQFYTNFQQTTHEEVIDLLKRSILFGQGQKQRSG